ncbi:hypothetical protein BSG1_07209 [Bacillus sp. SG-1]|nr:hypothetical protein BSG1_07209 [Bacillus sp. SG-1]
MMFTNFEEFERLSAGLFRCLYTYASEKTTQSASEPSSINKVTKI